MTLALKRTRSTAGAIVGCAVHVLRTFSQVAAAVLQDAREQEPTFNSVNGAYVKLVILETLGGAPAEIAEIEVLEGSRSGYEAHSKASIRRWRQRSTEKVLWSNRQLVDGGLDSSEVMQ